MENADFVVGTAGVHILGTEMDGWTIHKCEIWHVTRYVRSYQ